ncbi:hypothetical protein K435DRAFT_802122 [Dendrothele bispora CBS 962.96]|uniref:Uncharacterized protein n=1 Tax=Dendrothele bispora (strain CBS 962.96) TaxID=1314807 RepID=A0A4S8LMH4_DENBC|nr:hypothetical protein K435DRAFT_802122 [Dendrothele bispora CBS 962.96]
MEWNLCGSAPTRTSSTTGKIKRTDQVNVHIWIPTRHSSSSPDCALGFPLSFSAFPFRFPFSDLGPIRVTEVDITRKRPPASGVKSTALQMKKLTKDTREGLELQMTQSGKLDKTEWTGSNAEFDVDVLPVVVGKRHVIVKETLLQAILPFPPSLSTQFSHPPPGSVT